MCSGLFSVVDVSALSSSQCFDTAGYITGTLFGL